MGAGVGAARRARAWNERSRPVKQINASFLCVCNSTNQTTFFQPRLLRAIIQSVLTVSRSSSVLGWSHSLQASSRKHIDGRPQSARRPQQHLLRNIIYRARVPPSPAPSSRALRILLQALHHGRYRHGAAGSTFQMRDPFKRVRRSVLTASVQSSSSDHAAARHKQCSCSDMEEGRPLNKMMHASTYIDPCRATTSAICNSVGA